MGNNKNPRVIFNCDYCGTKSTERESHYKRKKRHFCSMNCYAAFRKDLLPKEEQHRYGTGFNKEERSKRVRARSFLNHAIRDGIIKRKPCEKCGFEKAEAHHNDYDKPLIVQWFCFKHHRETHKLLSNDSNEQVHTISTYKAS